jgi:hypothetical protein
MNDREWTSTNAGRGSIAVLALSAMVALWTLVHAIRIEPVPEVPPPEFASSAALAAPARAADADVEAAVRADLFASDRSAPAHAYRAPGEESNEAAPKEEPVLPVVLGTAVADPAHSFATVQLGDSRTRIVHAGDKIGEYTVQTIGRGRVVFTTAAGKKLDIPELKP